jgi:transposase
MHELPDLTTLTTEQKDALICQLFPLLEEVRKLTARVSELEVRLSKNSQNSSKPPSSDGYAKKTQSLRQPSGKKPGGQAGHPGQTLKRISEPDEIVVSPLPARCACGASLSEFDALIAERRQVVDVPLAHYHVVEHRTLQLRCTCGRPHSSRFPAEVTEAVHYGPNIRALAVHLTQGQRLPYGRAAQRIDDLYALKVSPATLLAWVGEASEWLHPSVDRIAQALILAPVAHADESGLRVAGKLHGRHTVVTDNTGYGVHARRGMEAIEAQGILPKRLAVLVHDGWAPYWQLECDHALCNAHLLRELTFLLETTGQAWSKRMMERLLAANEDGKSARQQGEKALAPEHIALILADYQAILREGEALNPEAPRNALQRGRVKQTPAFNLLRRLREHADEVLRFVSDLSVPFTNNLGERAIRMPKVKQKISGCFRSLEGANHFAIIRSYLDTLRKQGHNLLDALRLAFQGKPPQPATG